MNSGLRLNFMSHGGEVGEVPVRVEILDSSLRVVADRWAKARDTLEIELGPGLYGVRASLSSGRRKEQMVEVRPADVEDVHVALYELSPHESHEWAYFTHNVEAPAARCLSSPLYQGVWLRVWERSGAGWSAQPPPKAETFAASTWAEDGVSYSFMGMRSGLCALQTGGPRVPWKVTALPPTHDVMALLRPASERSAHPLDVVVSSDKWELETLLALMQSGDTSRARAWEEESRFAERLLYQKMIDPAAAAVGGYFLLRVNDLARLHGWPQNLADWMPWLPDGAVIHAWQLIAEAREGGDTDRLERARSRLLEAESRGFPIYTEGLRLLRDGLLLFDRDREGKDAEVAAALQRVGAYTSAADWSVATTTFTGVAPDRPSESSKRGTPAPADQLLYLFDVPLREAMRRGLIDAGDEIEANISGQVERATVEARGTLRLPDGRKFGSLGALHCELTGSAEDAWTRWEFASKRKSIWSVADLMRTQPRSRGTDTG